MFNFNYRRKEYHTSPLLRGVQIFLFILIVAGIALLATQKIWVPKVVDFIMTQESKNLATEVVEKKSGITAVYLCGLGKNIVATYYNGPALPPLTKDGPPRPTGSVALKFSDGRGDMTLAQTISADGIRYANSDESFVFWGKGDGAMILENGSVSKNYFACVQMADTPRGSNLSEQYRATDGQFSLRYGKGYVVDEKYRYEPELGVSIAGVKFTIPPALAEGTNLSKESYFSVEKIPSASECSAKSFFARDIPVMEHMEENYSVASFTGAGAGNRYEETVYAVPFSIPCTAVRYFLHYMVFENYAPGMVKEFNKASILKEFDQIRGTLLLNR